MFINKVRKSLKNSSPSLKLIEKESDFHHYEMNFHKHSKQAVFSTKWSFNHIAETFV